MSRLARNPFHVLELGPDCTARDVERAGQKLLAMLSVGFAGADVFASPLGLRARDPDLVRWAAAQLRDPVQRAVHEAWASMPTTDREPDPEAEAWTQALTAFGWGPR